MIVDLNSDAFLAFQLLGKLSIVSKTTLQPLQTFELYSEESTISFVLKTTKAYEYAIATNFGIKFIIVKEGIQNEYKVTE